MRSTRLDPESTDIAPGWPRPHYVADRDGQPKVMYAQWSSESASAQVMACSSDKTYTAGVYNLCSSCGTQLERGLLLDHEWVNANRPAGYVPLRDGGGNLTGHGRLDRYDVAFGSPLCFRCATFALHHCPLFSALDNCFAASLVWMVVAAADQFEEFDETTAIRARHPYLLPRITSGEVRAEVQARKLWLRDRSAADLPPLTRANDGTDATGLLLVGAVIKLSPGEVAALPAPAAGSRAGEAGSETVHSCPVPT